jgi:hypothetical protein
MEAHNRRKSMRIAVALILASSLFAVRAYAVEGAVGQGSEVCADLTKKVTASPVLMTQTYFPWAQGYMSGVNGVLIANGRSYRDLTKDPAGQQKALLDYCAHRPKSSFLDAVIAVYETRPIAH